MMLRRDGRASAQWNMRPVQYGGSLKMEALFPVLRAVENKKRKSPALRGFFAAEKGRSK